MPKKARPRTDAQLRRLASRPWADLSRADQTALRSWRAQKGHARRTRSSPDILKKLAERPWSSLTPSQQSSLRSWRGRRSYETRLDRRDRNLDLLARLNGDRGPEEKVRARADLRRVGTRQFADWLRSEFDWEDSEISGQYGFWFYVP